MIRLEQLRYDAGLTLQELADQVEGASRQTISDIETGKVKPRPVTLKALADYFGVTASELLFPAVPPVAAERPEAA